jgi:hydroxymethylglutaryl-CoA lyase
MKWPPYVTIKEVGPRDGLQNENVFISTEDKIAWINQLSSTGLTHIEITSFVNPRMIPALSDAIAVSTGITRVPEVTYTALVPNMKGLGLALQSNIDEVAVFMSASETHNRKNINKSIEKTLPILTKVVQETKSAGKPCRGYLSTVFGCPYEGEVDSEKVVRISEEMFAMGVEELSLGDTIGSANPRQVENLLEILIKRFPVEKLALHFHDTRGTALANIVVALNMGITTFDSSLGGLGGCPYAPGASGNVATEDLHYMVSQMGIQTGVNEEKLHTAAKFIQNKVGRPLPSHTLQVKSK